MKPLAVIILLLTILIIIPGCATSVDRVDVSSPIWVPTQVVMLPPPLPPSSSFRFQRGPDCIHLDPGTFFDWIHFMWAQGEWIEKARGRTKSPWGVLKLEPDAGPMLSDPVGALRKKL